MVTINFNCIYKMEKIKAIYRGYRDIVLKGRYFGYFLMAKIATKNMTKLI